MIARRILVTGASGFTGRYVLQRLEKSGFQPLILNSNLCDDVSLREEVTSMKPEAVIHLAGIAYVGHGNLADFYRVNVIGTLNLLQALEASQSVIGPVVLASSANIYGNAYQNEAIKETFQPHPINDYAMSKLGMEEMASLWKDRLPITIVRPFNYTGIDQSPNFVVPKIVEAYRTKKTDINLGNLSIWRDFSDVRDVARWYVEIIKNNITNKVINFCTDTSICLKDIVHMCEKLSNHQLKVNSISQLQRENELIYLRGDRTNLQQLLGNKSLPRYELQDTVQWMLFS